MGMTAIARVVDPQDVQIEMRLILSLGAWKRLSAELTHHWPASDLNNKIRDVIRAVERDSMILDDEQMRD